MGFLNYLGKKTTETTYKITKEAKLKMKIAENKQEISEIYKSIGRKIYENHVREENIDIEKPIKRSCIKIDKITREIEDARKEILFLNNKKQCENCYAEIEKEANFCPKCGERQTNEKTVFEQAEEKLEHSEISPQNEKEAEIVKEELQQKNNKE